MILQPDETRPAQRTVWHCCDSTRHAGTGWEAYENTNKVINRYRAETISVGYSGDTCSKPSATSCHVLAGAAGHHHRRRGIADDRVHVSAKRRDHSRGRRGGAL